MFLCKPLAFILKDEVSIVSFALFEGNDEEVKPLEWVTAETVFSGVRNLYYSVANKYPSGETWK